VYLIGQRSGPGRFALDPGCHLTESSPLVSRASRERLLEEWGPYWRANAAVRVEKSPPNLIRMRFLQALFPESAFLMVMRHPVAVACATQKWSHTSWTTLIHHWVAAHEIMLADSAHVSRVHVIRYEDRPRSGRNAGSGLEQLALPSQPAGGSLRDDVNRTYFDRVDDAQPRPRPRSAIGRAPRRGCSPVRTASAISPLSVRICRAQLNTGRAHATRRVIRPCRRSTLAASGRC
jgi:hypothetical protein